MNNLPCIRQVVLWLAHQRKRISPDELRQQFSLNEVALNALLHYLQNLELIKEVAYIGESEILSFVPDDITRRLAHALGDCRSAGGYVALPPRDHIFIVHGRNVQALQAIQEFLRSLQLKSITFTEAARKINKPCPHIDEIVAEGMANAYATLVIFTGDEEARLKRGFGLDDDHPLEMELQPQPRPNVIFEAGMALARDPERTILVQYGPHLRPFSNIAGLFVLPLTDSLDDRKTLKERLMRIGCKVNATSNKWRTAGRFPSPRRKLRGERDNASKPSASPA